MMVPVEVLVHSKRKTLELIYEDGTKAEFSFEFLRVFSPSAEVQGHAPSEAVLQVGCRDVAVVGVEPVGQYALKLIFSDGHDTVVYSWDYFEELVRTQQSRWEDYLAKLSAAGASRDPKDPANKPFLEKMKPQRSCGHHK